MSQLLPLILLPAGLAGATDEQFRALMDRLRQELAPSTVLEGFLVERIVVSVGRMRRAARMEADGKPLDSLWLRYEAAAERGFWKAYNELMKGRKAPGKSRPAAPPQSQLPPVAPAAPPEPPADPVPPPAPVAPSRPAAIKPAPTPPPAAPAVPSLAAIVSPPTGNRHERRRQKARARR